MIQRTAAVSLVTASLALGATHADRTAFDIRNLSFMAGCWEMRSGDRVVEEYWMPAAGGIMMGMGRTTRAGKLVESEHTRIEQHSDSVILFANPSGQSPSSFNGITVSANEVIFQNPEHDFPQRVIYRKAANGDSLLASVEGKLRGEMRTIRFPYARARCGGNQRNGSGVRSPKDGAPDAPAAHSD